MVIKSERKRKNEKTTKCEYCGKIGGNRMIHEKCAIEYLKKQGYSIYKFVSPLQIIEEALN